MATRPETVALNRQPERKATMEADLRFYHRRAQEAEDDLKIYVLKCWEQGMTDDELAEVFGIHRNWARKWREQGEQARERRRSGDPDRPGEYEPVS